MLHVVLFLLVGLFSYQGLAAQDQPQPQLKNVRILHEGGSFVLSNIRVWRYSELRAEMVPELAATMDNQTGKYSRDITFHVSVECQPGPGLSVADYDVTLFAVLPGVYPVKSTATPYNGKTQYCVPQSVSVSLVKATSGAGPAYVILGFSADDGEGEVSTHLEGILSVHFQEHGTMTEYVWIEPGGMKLHEKSTPRKAAFYCFPIEAGQFLLGGFITQMFPPQVAQFEGYVNLYAAPLTKAAYIGSFHLSRTENAEDKDRNSRPVVGSWVTEGHGRLNLRFDREAFKWMQTNLRKIKGFDIVISPSVTVQ